MFYIRVIKACIFLLVFWQLPLYKAKAQAMLPFMLPDVPQSTLFNPAYQNKTEKLFVGIPVFSGIYSSINTNFPFSSLFSKDFSYDLNKFYNYFDLTGKEKAEVRLSMFFTSLKINEYTFSLSLSDRSFSEGSFDREIVRIIRDGLLNSYGTNEKLGPVSFNFQYFREVAPGISKKLTKKLDAGLRMKILFGKMYFNAKDINFSIETDQQNNELLINMDGDVKLAGPYRHLRDTVLNFSSFELNMTPADYFFGARNMGIAFDAGVIFRPDEFSEFSLSFTDIGITGHKKNLYEIDFLRPLKYEEYSLYQSILPGQSYLEPKEALKNFGDLLSYIIDVENADHRKISRLPFKMNLTAGYKFSEFMETGITNQLIAFNSSKLSNLFSLYANMSAGKKTDIAASISFINFKKIYPGFGISTIFGRSQFFLTSNNILGIIDPTTSKHVNLCFGINFLIEMQKN